MRLGVSAMRPTVNFGVWGRGAPANVDIARLAESLGYDSLWTAEASGTDAIVPLAWMAAHTERIRIGTAVMQMSARAPTSTAMTAATMDLLSGGRFILGLGVSGPAVVEGWHGQAFGNPIEKIREKVNIVRAVLARHPVIRQGHYYRIPYDCPDSTGLAQAVRLMFRPRRTNIPVYLAAMGPRNVSLAYEIADGVMPAFYSPQREDAFFAEVQTFERSIDLAPFVPVALGADLQACRNRVKGGLAFWLGGMGAKGLNFYNRYISRLGFESAAERVQDLYSARKPNQAAAAIPDKLVDEIALCGTRERIADQLEVWKASSVTMMILNGPDVPAMRAVAETLL